MKNSQGCCKGLCRVLRLLSKASIKTALMKNDDSTQFLNIYNIYHTKLEGEKKNWQAPKLLTTEINIKQKQMFIF